MTRNSHSSSVNFQINPLQYSQLKLFSESHSNLKYTSNRFKKIIHTQGVFKGFLTEDQPKIKLKAKMIVVKMFNFIPGLRENIPMKKSLP